MTLCLLNCPVTIERVLKVTIKECTAKHVHHLQPIQRLTMEKLSQNAYHYYGVNSDYSLLYY